MIVVIRRQGLSAFYAGDKIILGHSNAKSWRPFTKFLDTLQFDENVFTGIKNLLMNR